MLSLSDLIGNFVLAVCAVLIGVVVLYFGEGLWIFLSFIPFFYGVGTMYGLFLDCRRRHIRS